MAAAALVAVLIVGRSSVEPGLVVATVGKPPDRKPVVIHGASTPKLGPSTAPAASAATV